MPLSIVAVLILRPMAPAQQKDLRRYRYGKTAPQIESMGEDAFSAFFARMNPDAGAGFMRGVADGVYVGAYRENTAQRYRSRRDRTTQTRLLALDKQMRYIGVLFSRTEWLFTGGNAYDPDGDTLDYAMAERRLYVPKAGTPDPARMRQRLGAYRDAIRRRSRNEPLYGAPGDPTRGRKDLALNLTKLDGAVARATALCRTPGERAVLFDFVSEQAKPEPSTATSSEG